MWMECYSVCLKRYRDLLSILFQSEYAECRICAVQVKFVWIHTVNTKTMRRIATTDEQKKIWNTNKMGKNSLEWHPVYVYVDVLLCISAIIESCHERGIAIQDSRNRRERRQSFEYLYMSCVCNIQSLTYTEERSYDSQIRPYFEVPKFRDVGIEP